MNLLHPVLDAIADNEEAAQVLDRLADFHLTSNTEEAPSFSVEGHRIVAVFAEDSTGGQFALVESDADRTSRVLYVSSEGEAGVIAETIPAVIELMIAVPYWRDCLHFSGGGQLAEMLRVQPLLESDERDRFPTLQRMREQLLSAVSLSGGTDHLELLHRCSSSPNSPSVMEVGDGWKLSGLAGSFVVESNPKWRSD